MASSVGLKILLLVKKMIFFVIKKHELLNSKLENLQLCNLASVVKENRYDRIIKLKMLVDSLPTRNFLRH